MTSSSTSFSTSVRLYHLLRTFFSQTENLCLATEDGRPLFYKSRYIADASTLAESVSLVTKWVPIAPGQMLVLNERTLSGTNLSALTFIYRPPKTPAISSSIYLCQRHYFTPTSLSVESAGDNIVIPPTLVVERAIPTWEIIEAITDHPFFFPDAKKVFKSIIQEIINSAEQLAQLLTAIHLPMSDTILRSYFKDEQQYVKNALGQLPEGTSTSSLAVGNGQSIQLLLEFNRGRLKLDFSGTSSAGLSMTAPLTFAGCLSAVSRILLGRQSLLTGLGQHLSVIAPQNIFPDRGQIATVQAVIEGTYWIDQAVTQALGQYSPQYQSAQHGLSCCPALIKTDNQPCQLITSPVGMAGSLNYRGRNAVFVGNDPITNFKPLLAANERSSSVRTLAYHLRRNSGGKGKNGGGNGLVQSYISTENCVLEWSFSNERAKGAAGGKAGAAGQIQLQPSGKEWEDLPTSGQRQLHPGDAIAILSPGGGGYGAPS